MKKIKFMVVAALFLSLASLGVFSAKAWAVDPLEAGPTIYKKIFENERVRVMEVTFQPGEKIAEHIHPDHFAYILEGGKLRLSYPDGTTKELEGKSGDVVWIPAETHSAENVGTTEFKALITELKAK